MKCNCCEREAELRMGYCIVCAGAESVIIDGTDIYDNPIPEDETLTEGMNKLKYILKQYNVIK